MPKDPNICFKAALSYLSLGYSVIPLGKDGNPKKPLIKWEEFQKRLPTEQEIKDWWAKWPDANVGIVTGYVSQLAVIDVDDIEVGKTALAELIPDSLTFPIADTPRGGEHWYFACPNGNLGNNAKIVPGCDFRANGGYVVAPPSVNKDGKAWRWREDLKPLRIQPPFLPHTYVSYIKTNTTIIERKKEHPVCEGVISKSPSKVLTFEHGTRDDNLFSLANVLAKGGMDDGNILQVLKLIANNWGEGNLDEWFEDKIKSAVKRKEHREINISQELEALLSVTNGAFSVTEALQSITSALPALQTVTGVMNRYRNAVRQVLHRWKKEGKIKPWGKKDGWYIRVDLVVSEIDWWNADLAPYPIKYPFQIENYAFTYKKNIILIAGEPNSGKTAFCLNIARMNWNAHKVLYCSSELGQQELKTRLAKFECPIQDWRKVRFIEKSANFSDDIDPDGLNIIDYMELTDEFYKVAAYIREIFDKLQNGICIIAIQKDPNKTLGRGATMGLENPRLYLSMSPGVLRIVKAKAWVNEEVNPNGMVQKFKLVQGCRFIKEYGWGME